MICDNCKKELDKRRDYFLKFKSGKTICVKCLERKSMIISMNSDFNTIKYKDKITL